MFMVLVASRPTALFGPLVVVLAAAGPVAPAVGGVDRGGQKCAGGSPDCAERRAADECNISPLIMAAECPEACDHNRVNSWNPVRSVVDEVVPRDVSAKILELAPDAVVPGDGFGGDAYPFVKDELFAGVTPRDAARWAISQPEEGGRRAKAIDWAKTLFRAVHTVKRTLEDRLETQEELSYDFVQLTCKKHDPTKQPSARSPYSHPPHADNCFRQGNTCVRKSPFYWWRTYSASLFLHGAEEGDFDGGSFFFTPHWDSDQKAYVAPRAGRMVAFSAGASNIHGVTKLTRGVRCALAVWLTDDENKAVSKDEVSEAEDILAGVPTETSYQSLRDSSDQHYKDMCAATADAPRAAPQSAMAMGSEAIELPLPNEGRSMYAEVVTKGPGPQITQIHDFLTPDELGHFIKLAKPKLKTSTVFEGGKLTTASYRTSQSGWLSDDPNDEIISRLLARIEAVTGLTLAFAEDLQVAHYDPSIEAKYSPHLDWGQTTKVTDDFEVGGVPGGPRVATLLMYLDAAERGGSTAFVDIDTPVVPKAGSAIFWYNIRPSRQGDELVRHGACPVLAGHKYVMTKWIHLRGNEHVLASAAGHARLEQDWHRVAQRLRRSSASLPADALVVRYSCEQRRAAGDCLASPLEMIRGCPNSCGEDGLESPWLRRFVMQGIASKETCDTIRELAPQATTVGDGYAGKSALSSGEDFAGVTPTDAARWAVSQPVEGGRRQKAVAWAKAYIRATEDLKRATEARHGIGELWADYIHLTCRTHHPETPQPEFEIHLGYIPNNHRDILVGYMTPDKAKEKCADLTGCRGFTFEGTAADQPAKVYFKGVWDIAGGATSGWTSYKFEQPDSASHVSHADNCWYRDKDQQCVRARPSYHWRSHSSVLFIDSPDEYGYEGGDFFYSPEWKSKAQVRMSPMPGQAVTFSAGSENIHGVTSVTRGTRCALLTWFTEDRGRAAHRSEITQAEEVLSGAKMEWI